MDTNNYSRFPVTNFTSIYCLPIVYLVLCRRNGYIVIKDKPCFERVPSLVEETEH